MAGSLHFLNFFLSSLFFFLTFNSTIRRSIKAATRSMKQGVLIVRTYASCILEAYSILSVSPRAPSKRVCGMYRLCEFKRVCEWWTRSTNRGSSAYFSIIFSILSKQSTFITREPSKAFALFFMGHKICSLCCCCLMLTSDRLIARRRGRRRLTAAALAAQNLWRFCSARREEAPLSLSLPL